MTFALTAMPSPVTPSAVSSPQIGGVPPRALAGRKRDRSSGVVARMGKIARLPAAIRGEVNRRLHDGEPMYKIVAWLNAQPVVLERLAAMKNCGKKISESNVSMWRHTGYRDFVARLETAEIAKLIRG